MDLIRVQAFLAVADELHFGRAAQRLGLSQPRVSRLISALEREAGGALFDRTTRRVRLTPLGDRLRDGWRPAYGQLLATLDDARAAARRPEGILRVGFTLTTGGPALTQLVRAFTAAYPGCDVRLREVSQPDLYEPLRRDDIDVLVGWLAVDEPDLTAGPAIEHRDRALAVSRDHPLARRGSATAEDLADYETVRARPDLVLPGALRDAISPPRTPSGRLVRRTRSVASMQEVFELVASGQIVHPTAAGLTLAQRGDIALLPLDGLPPLRLGLIWCTAHENARIRALAEVAEGAATPRPGPPGVAPAPVRR
ncbi:MAG: LysR family transcriptional regulator [Nocardiopsaceae bacterium]|nr:LysR family transcriptional regulator [Nocardiopsaceae bacterium]